MIDIIFAYKAADEFRRRNLTTAVAYYRKHVPDANFIIVEQGTDSDLKDLGPITHMRIKQVTPEFSKSRCINAGFKRMKTDRMFQCDIDAIFDKGFLDLITSEDPGHDLILPYNKPMFKMDKRRTSNFSETLEVEKGVSLQLKNWYKGAGGLYITKKAYYETGGFNERFYGYGFEDVEFVKRASLKFEPYCYDGECYHTWHPIAKRIEGENNRNKLIFFDVKKKYNKPKELDAMIKELQTKQLDVTKFILLSQHRNGTFLLQTALDSHDKVSMTGELYIKMRSYNYSSLDIKESPSFKGMIDNSFKPKRPFQTARGFVYHRLRNDDIMFYDYLMNHKDIKVIFLERTNHLKTYISDEKAQSNKLWKVRKDNKKELEQNNKIKKEKVYFSPEKFTKSLIVTKERVDFYIDKLKDHDVLRVTYEDLTSDYDNEISRVLNFINVDDIKLNTNTQKCVTTTLENSVSNYDQMVEFLNTEGLDRFLINEPDKSI